MASIRIVDDWLRSPLSPPSRWRAVMVIAEKWAEQRVLMRAYAESRDQMRPTIMMHGAELAIGPAGTDPNGPWGIHVGENPDGKAQEIKTHFEHAARRLAGSKGNPPRLQDEEPTFDREPTGTWAPGAPRVLPKRPPHPNGPAVDFVVPTTAARVPQVQHAQYVPQQRSAVQHAHAHTHASTPSPMPAVPGGSSRVTPLQRARGRTRPPPIAGAEGAGASSSMPRTDRTALGFASGSGAQSLLVRLGLDSKVASTLGRLVERVVPSEFHIDPLERRVLNALGHAESLTARAIGQLLDVADAVSFMEELTRKLEAFDVDLIVPAEPQGGEPTYRLRR